MHKPIAVALLLRLPMMAGLTESQAEALADAAQKKTFKNGERLVIAGESTDNMFLILSGRANVELSELSGDSDKTIAIATLGVGECIGEMSLVDQQPHCADVVADGPLHALVLNPQTFIAVLQENPQVAVRLLKAMFRHLARANRQIVWLSTVSVQGRVARTLMDLALLADNGELHIKTKVTAVALAKKVGASREMVGKALKEFQAKGFIQKALSGGLRINDKRKKPRH
jgi:CRP-like cAMP-binding protein